MFKVLQLIARTLLAHVIGRGVITLALFMCCLPSIAIPNKGQSESSSPPEGAHTLSDSFVRTAIKGIIDAPSRKVKIQRAQDLNQWVVRHPGDISTADVDSLATLLSDEDDTVRLWIAGALGQLGDKARSAVPQLQRALLERPCANAPATSAAAIRLALLRIGSEPVNAQCTAPFGT